MSWQLAFVLNNLALRQSFNSEYVAVVGPKDERLLEFVALHLPAKHLVDGFKSTGGRKVDVSAILVRDDAPAPYKSLDAVYSFRNVFALASLIEGIQQQLHDRDCTVWSSTFFDIYPVQLDSYNSGLVTISPAVRGWDEAAKFQGQPDPSFINTDVHQPQPDAMVQAPLLGAWKRHTERPRSRVLSVLFRSLEVAYQAASLPRSSSIHEYGSRVALWVSAMEILAHPAKSNANLGTVLDLLAKSEWKDEWLKKAQFVVKYQGKRRRVPFVSKLYQEMYRARNDFLHGNDVSFERLFPFKKKSLPPLLRAAPLVYKSALLVYLEGLRDKRRRRAHRLQGSVNVLDRRYFEESLLKLRAR